MVHVCLAILKRISGHISFPLPPTSRCFLVFTYHRTFVIIFQKKNGCPLTSLCDGCKSSCCCLWVVVVVVGLPFQGHSSNFNIKFNSTRSVVRTQSCLDSMSTHCDIVVFGGCVADAIHRPEDAALRATSMHGTSNRCALSTSFGGVGRNVTEACARMGMDVLLVSAVGDDIVGNAIVASLRSLGRVGVRQQSGHGGCGEVTVDDVHIIRGAVTATYTAILDGSGELCVASAVMAILDQCLLADRLLIPSARVAAALQTNATWFVLEGNIPKAELTKAALFARQCSRISTDRRQRPFPLLIAHDPISASKAERAVDALGYIDLIKPNLTEVIVLGRLCGLIDTASETVALRVAEEIDASAAAAADGNVRCGVVDDWLKAIGLPSSSFASTSSQRTGGSPLVHLAGSKSPLSHDVCKALAATLHRIVVKLLLRFPQLVVVCTLGPLGCAVGIGQTSFLKPMMAGSTSKQKVSKASPAILCFPPADVNKAAIRKVTGAGDSFLSGFIVATTRLLRARQQRAPTSPTPLCDIIRAANAAAAAALTSHQTISPLLCPELVERAISVSPVIPQTQPSKL